ncbi:hypothetical protein C2G38_1606407 [Gigaspora rosea]|uniref:Uncharacterized protein n=1 Tax=Gigaspora rosea TaxID=44941 RepID=A0A397UXX3_9GLOM|nr:hypothetical protein C2G38_1606407 [Gigaspora rosea]
MITIIRPAAIVGDTYICAQYFLYLIREDTNQTEYLNPGGWLTSVDFFKIHFISIAILFIITLNSCLNNKLPVKINQALAIFKVAVLFAFAIMGIIIGSRNTADAFTDAFNNTISSNETLFEKYRKSW